MEIPMTSMMAPLVGPRAKRRSPTRFSVGFSSCCRGLCGCRGRPPWVDACCDRAWAVRPTATSITAATTLSFSHIIIFRTPSVRLVTAVGNAQVAHAVAARAVDRTSCRGMAARASPIRAVPRPTPSTPGARPRCASLSRNLSRPLASRLFTVATGQFSSLAAWSYVIPWR